MQQIFKQPFIAAVIIIGTILSIGLASLSPFLSGRLFDILYAIYKGEQPALLYIFPSGFKIEYYIMIYLIAIFAVGILSFVINITVGVLNEYIAQMTEKRIREDFYASVQSKSMAFHDTTKVGELMSQATFDVRIINATVSPGLRMITQAIISALVAFGMIIYYNWRLILVVLAFLPFYLWAVISYARKLRPLTEKVQTQFGQCNALLQENVSGIRVVRAFTAEKSEIKRFRKEVDTLRDDIINRGVQQARYFPPLLLSLTITLSLGLSVIFVLNGTMSGGDAIAANGFLIQLYNPTYQISWVLYLTHMGLAGAKRIIKTMKEESIIIEKQNAVELTEVNGKIEYRNVSFSYQKLKNLIDENTSTNDNNSNGKEIRDTLSDISFVVEPGDVVALLGPTGCGKSTVTKLLARMYDVNSGKILIDNHNIQDLTLESLRKNIGIIEQDIFLFSTSIKENIAYGVERKVSDEEIIEYAKAAQAHEFIESFDDKYETLVGERGVTLSGGQKQRIAIARTFLADPKILILDDSASAIDAQTEEKIQLAMDNLLKGRTVFIITHRLSTIKRANKIIVMRKGKITAIGTHDILLKTSEDYRRVFGRHLDLPPIIEEENAIGGSK